MIVVDLGCASYPDYPEEESVNKLIDRFHPSVLLGFDPMAIPSDTMIGTTRTQIKSTVAWTHDGWAGLWRSDESCHRLKTKVSAEYNAELVPCFDLAHFILRLPRSHEIVLKMDVEGGEYTLLPHLIEQGADERLQLALVEFHELRPAETKEILDSLRCPLEKW